MPASTSPKVKPDLLFFALALITIALSSWGLFHLFTDFAGMPGWLAVAVIGGLDLAAVAFGKFALTVSGDGDSSASWNLLLLGFMVLAAWVQYTHAQLAAQPRIIGITMAAFPVATVLLFEGQLRRAARLNGRARGVVAPPRQTVPLLVWIHFPRRAWHATRQAILAQGHLEDTGPDKAKPRQARRTAGSNTPIVAESAPRPARDKPGQSVAASVEAAAGRVGRDVDTVWQEVQRTTHPGVSRDTVRKSLSRLPTNGHVAGVQA